MNIFRTQNKDDFLADVSEFILTNFADKLKQQLQLDNLTVIVPNNYCIPQLQKLLIRARHVAILPNIISVNQLGEHPQSLSLLENKLIIANILTRYPEHNYSIIQALDLATNLLQLFNYLERYHQAEYIASELEVLKSSNDQNASKLLYYTYTEWQQALVKSDKLSSAVCYQKNCLELLNAIREKPDHYLLLAGLYPADVLISDLMIGSLKLSNSYLIFSPLPNNIFVDEDNYSFKENDVLYNLQQFFKRLEIKKSSIKAISSSKYDNKKLLNTYSLPDILLLNSLNINDLTLDKLALLSNRQINYTKTTDIFAEAELISQICCQYPDEQIAIIVNNVEDKNIYINFLRQYGLKFNDLIAEKLSDNHHVVMLIYLADFLCQPFNLVQLFRLLKHPFLLNDVVWRFEKLLQGHNRFTSSWDECTTITIKSDDQELIEWQQHLIKILTSVNWSIHNKNKRDNATQPGYSFSQRLKDILSMGHQLSNKFSSNYIPDSILKTIKELIRTTQSSSTITPLLTCTTELFPKLLKKLFVQNYYKSEKEYYANITICKPEYAAYVKFHTIILAGFNEDNWPTEISNNTWLSADFKKRIIIDSENIELLEKSYNLYLILSQYKKIFITKVHRKKGQEIAPSNYFLRLKFLCDKLGINNYISKHKALDIQAAPSKVSNTNSNNKVITSHFPNTLSATDIELLIHNPYGFYAKKILGLKKDLSIATPIQTFEYGNFVHKVFETYSKNYIDGDFKIKLNNFLNNTIQLLDSITLPIVQKNIWYNKLKTLAPEYINFEEQDRKNSQVIYIETKGQMQLDILGQPITITAIADRISIDRNYSARVIDYKTGTIPTTKSIESGLAIQLIVVALIARYGGFTPNIRSVSEITYVKVAGSQPYINLQITPITERKLEKHLEYLKRLLKYYVEQKSFTSLLNEVDYDDYQYLKCRNATSGLDLLYTYK